MLSGAILERDIFTPAVKKGRVTKEQRERARDIAVVITDLGTDEGVRKYGETIRSTLLEQGCEEEILDEMKLFSRLSRGVGEL